MIQSRLLLGDCVEVLRTLDAESLDACVTDPPYDLTSGKQGGSGDASMNTNSPAGRSRIGTGGGFMGLAWDATGIAFRPDTWGEVSRVLKPGAHLLACGGTRTYHRMAAAIEDADFEIRDVLAWLYGSGFPKSLNLGEGLGTALKPAYEPIVLARKPFKGSVKGNVEKHGTGALNIDACRIEGEPWEPHDATGLARDKFFTKGPAPVVHKEPHDLGRWPANVVIDDLAAMVLDEQSGELCGGQFPASRGAGGISTSGHAGQAGLIARETDSGGASRFYYCAKPSREERDMGCYDLAGKQRDASRDPDAPGANNPRNRGGQLRGNFHPTVKPIELMRWLVKLVTPINGTVIDPFLGSGTTGIACRYELRGFIGIEREAEYLEIARRRIDAAAPLFAERPA